MCFRSAANFLLLSTTLISQTLAFEVAAIVREINVEQGVAVVFANGQQRNVIIADKVKTLDEQGKELRRGFSNGTDTMAHSFQCLQIGRDVANAVDFIRTNISEGVQVSNVATKVDLSRSTLDNRFKQILGRTVHDEIERVRLERSKELLLTTDCTLAQVAKRTGFGTVQYLATVFRKSMGQTPGEYRKSHATSSFSSSLPNRVTTLEPFGIIAPGSMKSGCVQRVACRCVMKSKQDK